MFLSPTSHWMLKAFREKTNLSQGHTFYPEPFQAGAESETISSCCSVDGMCFCTDGVCVGATALGDTRDRQEGGRRGKLEIV